MARIVSISIIALLLAAGLHLAPGSTIQPAQAAKNDKSASEEYLSDAQNYLAKGDVNAAIIQLKNALQKDPGNIGARKLPGEIYLRVGNGPAAEKEFRAALRRGGDDRTLTALLASAYPLQGKFDKVLAELKDDVTDPGIRLEILVARGRAYLGLQMRDKAREAFVRAEKLKDYTGAEEALQQAGARLDNHLPSVFLKGALDYAERALKRPPKSPAVMDTLGWILFKQGPPSRAPDLLRRASTAAPKQGDIAYQLAVVLRKGGDTRDSGRTLRRILRAKAPFDKLREAGKMLKEMGG